MSLIRSLRARRHRDIDLRDVGFAAAMGDEVEVAVDPAVDPGSTCGTCGAAGRLDMVDATVQRAFLTCPRCGRTWETARLEQFVS